MPKNLPRVVVRACRSDPDQDVLHPPIFRVGVGFDAQWQTVSTENALYRLWIPPTIVVVGLGVERDGCFFDYGDRAFFFMTIGGRIPAANTPVVVLPFPHIYSYGAACPLEGDDYEAPSVVLRRRGEVAVAQFWAAEFFASPFEYFEGGLHPSFLPVGAPIALDEEDNDEAIAEVDEYFEWWERQSPEQIVAWKFSSPTLLDHKLREFLVGQKGTITWT